jgi:HTH-type transcriptional regulator, sugar sensing transcriptional regulator
MSEPIALMQQLGFSEYEARAYVALLERSPLNGYELAKSSGLPRANVYAVLQKLEERAAVVRVDTPSGARFAPVPPDELTRRLGGHFEEILNAARGSLSEISKPAPHPQVWNAEGYTALLERARAIIGAAHEQLLLATWPEEAQALSAAVSGAVTRGVSVSTLCLRACPGECGGCHGDVCRGGGAPQEGERWLVIVADEAEVLTGEIAAGEQAQLVGSRQQLLVGLAARYIRNSIGLARVLGDLDADLQATLAPETQALLAQVRAGGLTGVRPTGISEDE